MTTEVQMAVENCLENVELVEAVMAEALARFDCGDRNCYEVGMAVREAVINAIQHGNRLDPTKRVRVDLALAGGEIVVRVEDEGDGFDPERLRDPLTPSSRLQPDGRGILFMKQFMDEIEYTFHTDGGTIVTLRKRVR